MTFPSARAGRMCEERTFAAEITECHISQAQKDHKSGTGRKKRRTSLSQVLREKDRQADRAAGASGLIQLMLCLTEELAAGKGAKESWGSAEPGGRVG